MKRQILTIAFLLMVLQMLPGAIPQKGNHTGQIALFFPQGFPTIDSQPIPLGDLKKALQGFDYAIFSSLKDLKKLDPHKHSLLILPFGSAFPFEGRFNIRNYLEGGGNLLVLGGAPFHRPVLKDQQQDLWHTGVPQPTFARELLIGPAEKLVIPTGSLPHLTWSPTKAFPKGTDLPPLEFKQVFSMTVRFTTTKYFPQEDGSTGPYLARMRPLVHILDKKGIPRYCPVLEIDRIQGKAKGGRWVFAPVHTRFAPAWIRLLVKEALKGSSHFEIHPKKASLHPGETPQIRVAWSGQPPKSGKNEEIKFRVKVKNSKEKILLDKIIKAGVLNENTPLTLYLEGLKNLKPGLYRVMAWVVESGQPGATCGFCIRDEVLLKSGPMLSASRDWLRREGKVFPVIGTTYMGPAAHRRFILEPNPGNWYRDFERMASVGVNFVRTGIWTGWSELIDSQGKVKESVLRALDAYVQCAAAQDIMISFTFFAFLPPNFGGVNPYLDPLSLAGQESFIQDIAGRYRGIHWIHFDLINEPSYASPRDLWLTRPIGDHYEQVAWSEWLLAKHGPMEANINRRLQDSREPFSLPLAGDFSYARIKNGASPLRALEFNLFIQEVFARWTARLSQKLKGIDRQKPVTIGQDEGGTGTRPCQQFFAPHVDYTSMHTWWYNDDLLWDGLVTRVPEKPNLVSETGMMRLEDMTGMPWRNPKEAAALLERKFAQAFAARGAGAIQWIWNINPYMPLDNEAVIGSFRVDGTAKPELEVISRFADFFDKAAPYLDDFEPDRVVVVLPHSRLYAGRPMGVTASQKIIRLLAEHYDTFPLALSEYQLTPQRLSGARLLIIPVPGFLDEKAARLILNAAQKGCKVLVTGPLLGTPYGEMTAEMKKLGAGPGLTLSFHESYGKDEWLSFGAGATQFIRKAGTSGAGIQHKNIIREPLPLEFAGDEAALVRLLGKSLKEAGLPAQYSTTPLPCRLLYAPRSILGICVNETNRDLSKKINNKNGDISIKIKAGHARLFLLDRVTGKLLLLSRSDSDEKI